MKLILHIGTDKTGSTAIQRHIYSNRQWLLDRSVFVPLTGLGKDNGHAAVLSSLDTEALSQLAEELAAADSKGYSSALLSWEGMSFMNEREIDLLIHKLRRDDVWLVVYLRDQADIVQSGYLQEIKTKGSPVAIYDFQRSAASLRGIRARKYCYSRSRDYAKLLKRWMRVIKRGRVLVREFQRDKLLNESIVDDFLSVLGLSPDPHFSRMEGLSNLSLDVESAMLMNEFDTADHDSLQRMDMSSLLQSLVDSEGPETRYFLSSRQVKAIRRHFRRSNASIPDITGSSLSPLFQTPPDCFTSDTVTSLSSQVRAREKKLKALQVIPIVFASQIPHRKPSPDILIRGWQTAEAGVWTAGDISSLRFRVPFWMSRRPQGEIIIFMKGHYTQGNSRTQVSVNGVDYGWQDLSKFSEQVRLPVPLLRDNQILELNLRHELQEPPTQPIAGIEMSAFWLRRFGIQFFNPD